MWQWNSGQKNSWGKNLHKMNTFYEVRILLTYRISLTDKTRKITINSQILLDLKLNYSNNLMQNDWAWFNENNLIKTWLRPTFFTINSLYFNHYSLKHIIQSKGQFERHRWCLPCPDETTPLPLDQICCSDWHLRKQQ